MRPSKLPFLLCFFALAALAPAHGQQVATSADPYTTWATSQWGTSVVNDPAQAATVWGPSADPDHDGLTNLQEYAFGTDPRQPNAYPVTQDFGTTTAGYLTLNYTQRANDAALVVFPQYSTDLQTWWPVPPRDSFSWQGDATYFWDTTNAAVGNGLQAVTKVCTYPLANSPAAFCRVLVMRSGTVAIGSPLDAVAFFDSVSGQAGGSVDSNSVVLSGFAGSVAMAVSGGAHLIVNGVDLGASANVAAGSTVRIRAVSPANGASASYALTIGGTLTKTWNVASRAPVAPALTLPTGSSTSTVAQTASAKRTGVKTAAMTVAPGISNTPSGYTPVSASVGESGAANISIPITVPPGTGGMEPKLAITYSSQGGNGTLGMGFGLAGLSAVTRTGPVQYLDGIKGGVTFGPNDRFTLDGQRLVLYAGSWGADGSEYRTENESFSQVTFHGSGSTSYWQVKTKAGLTYYYGTSDDSRILANRASVPGDTATLSWAVTDVGDANGNRFICHYATPTATDGGYPRITSIVYTLTAQNQPAGEEVDFTYTARPDVRTSYVAGAKVTMGQVLTAIECKQGGNVARHYDFAYQQAEISNNSQLVSVTEKGKQPTNSGDTWQTFPATFFTWQTNDPPGFANGIAVQTDNTFLGTTTINQYAPFASDPPSRVVQGDFNGDGVMDLLGMDDHPASYGLYQQWIALGKLGGGFVFNSKIPGLESKQMTSADYSRLRTADVDGDGKTDLIHVIADASDNWVALSNGDGSFRVLGKTQIGSLGSQTMQPTFASELLTLDLNGDGRTDVVYLESGKSKVHLGNGDGTFTALTQTGLENYKIEERTAYQGWGWVIPGDFNGDGIPDILYIYLKKDSLGHQTWLALGKGDGTFDMYPQDQIGGADKFIFENDSQLVSGDFNGDGITDVFCVKRTRAGNVNWVTFGSGGPNFNVLVPNAEMQLPPIGGPDSSHIMVADLNGDGLDDIYHADALYPTNPIYSWVALSNGDGTFQYLPHSSLGTLDGKENDRNDDSRYFVGDFDGDGTAAILQYNRYGRHYLVQPSGFNKNRVVQVTNGHGGYTKFNYKPLTDPTVYPKRSGAQYPTYDVIGGMYVVSSIFTRNAVDGDAFTVQTSPAVVESETDYSYEKAWSLLDGHGYRGFAAVRSFNKDTGITFRTEYVVPNLTGRPVALDGSHPLTTADQLSVIIGSQPAYQVQTLSDGTVISETINSWDAKTTSSFTTTINGQARTYQAYFPYATQSVTKNYEINNGKEAAPIKTTTVSGQTYDAYGNLTHSLTDYGGGFTEETTSTYTNDTTHWWLGRLGDTVVKQTSPGPVTATRHSTFQYSPTNGQLTRETIVTPESNLQLQKDYVHDTFGNIKQSTLTDLGTGATRTTQTTYTPDGRFINQTTNALGQVESKTYDPLNGTVLTQTGPNGLTTTWTYDGFGRPVTETRPDGTQTFTWYRLCAPGNGVPPRAAHCVITQSSGSGPSTVLFDLLDRQIRQDATGFDGSTVSTHTVFDVKGEAVNTSLPFFSSSSAPTAPSAQYATNYFDAIGRVIQQNVPGGTNETGPRITTTAYAGLSTTVTNPKKQTFQTTADLRGRTAASTSFGTDTVTNTHDPYGNLIQVDDGNGHLTQMLYDGRGNKIKMVEPNSGTTTYGYNAFGELTSQTDALKRTTTLSYDALGRMVRRVESDAPGLYNGTQIAGQPVETDWVYEYGIDGQPNPNGVGKLGYVWRQSDGYLESYRYDTLGRLTETLTQVGAMRFVTATTFDEYSRPDTLSYPTGFAVRNHYNAYGHLDYVYDTATSATHYWTATSVNARGQVVQEQLGNGLVTQRGYDPYTGLLGSIQTGSGSGIGFSASVQNLAYTFDELNNLKERRDLNRGVTEDFTYNATNQLSGTTCSAAAPVTITCDHLGNIAYRSDVGTYTYGEHNAGPHAVTSIAGVNGQPAHTLFYNAVGNCTQKDTTTLEYNAANQPVAIHASAGTILFAYTPGRARLKRTELVAGALTNRVYVGSLYERDDGPNGIVHTHFIPAGGGVVAIHTRTQTTAGTTCQTSYIHKDHLGSVQTLTDENKNIVDTLSYDAWGRRRTLTLDQTTQSLRYSYTDANGKPVSDSQTDRGFTGHEMLDVVGLIHMNGRIYDPTIGRFLSVDPVVQEAGNLQNLNRYCYVLNNPLSMTDPSGFFFKGLRHFFEKHWRTIAAIALALPFGTLALIAADAIGITGTIGLAAAAGAGLGFGQAFTGTLLSGGSVGDALRAGAQAAPTAALASGAANLVGTAYAGSDFKPFVHGVVQGGIRAAEGGRFTHTFLSASFASLAGGYVDEHMDEADGGIAPRTFAAAIAGGTAEVLGGGKFANGAVTGAFVHLFNDEAHRESDVESTRQAIEGSSDGFTAAGALVKVDELLADTAGGVPTGLSQRLGLFLDSPLGRSVEGHLVFINLALDPNPNSVIDSIGYTAGAIYPPARTLFTFYSIGKFGGEGIVYGLNELAVARYGSDSVRDGWVSFGNTWTGRQVESFGLFLRGR